MSLTQTTKVQAFIGSAWYQDCDPFLSVAIRPGSRYGKNVNEASAKLERIAIADASDQWKGCDSGETKTQWLAAVCVSGCFLEDVELNPEQLEDFNGSQGFCHLEAN